MKYNVLKNQFFWKSKSGAGLERKTHEEIEIYASNHHEDHSVMATGIDFDFKLPGRELLVPRLNGNTGL